MKSLNLFICGAGIWTQGLVHAGQILCHWAHEVSRFVTGWFNQTTQVPQGETDSETYAILLLYSHPCVCFHSNIKQSNTS